MYSVPFPSVTLTLMFQVSPPVELPTLTLVPKHEVLKTSTFTAPSPTMKSLSTNQKVPVATNPVSGSDSQVPSKAAAALLVDDGDEELDQLLSLQKPVTSALENQSAADENAVPEKGDYILLVLIELSSRILATNLYYIPIIAISFARSLQAELC